MEAGRRTKAVKEQKGGLAGLQSRSGGGEGGGGGFLIHLSFPNSFSLRQGTGTAGASESDREKSR